MLEVSHNVTSITLKSSEYITNKALSFADYGLNIVGSRDGELYKSVLGLIMKDQQSTEAIFAVFEVLKKFFQREDDISANISILSLYRPSRIYSKLQFVDSLTSNIYSKSDSCDEDSIVKLQRYHRFVCAASPIGLLKFEGILPVDLVIDSEEECIEFLTGINRSDILYYIYIFILLILIYISLYY